MANLTKCQKCGLNLIFEESKDHTCRDVLNYEIKGGILWLYDGEMWYPRKLLHQQKTTLSTKRKQREESTEDEPDPQTTNII